MTDSYADHASAMLARGFVMTLLGGGTFGTLAYSCTTCAALVAERQTILHRAWHQQQLAARAADESGDDR